LVQEKRIPTVLFNREAIIRTWESPKSQWDIESNRWCA